MKPKFDTSKVTLSRSFLTWLTIIVAIGFAASFCASWLSQTDLAHHHAKELLQINIQDVKQSILDASDDNLLEIAREIAKGLPNELNSTSEELNALLEKYDASEIHLVNNDGIIINTTTPEFLGFDMHNGDQSSEFLCLIDGYEKEYVQPFRPISYDNATNRKYAGIRFMGGGFVQVGYNEERFQQDVDKYVVGKTHNRHIGKGGFILIADHNWSLVSDPFKNEGLNLYVSGLWVDPDETPMDEVFHATVYNTPCSCMFATMEGYYIVATVPDDEIVMQRDTSVALTTALEINVFIMVFVMLFLLVRNKVVKRIGQVNKSLSKITEGELDEVVDVRSNVEFSMLSDDINATVSTLKQYISIAAARYDEELALAKAIQQSAVPSVFPLYPDRTDFSIFASMDTAKEVGGDFYDYYLLGEHKLAFLVADVSGKGIPAAMFMMTGKTVIRDHAERGDKPADVMMNANDRLCDGNDAKMFITAWMGFLETDTGLVRFVNAGHNPPVLIRNGKASFIKQQVNMVMAALQGLPYFEQTLQLEPGDLLYLYTDGVTEAESSSGKMYGEDRLIAILSSDFGTGEDACTGVCHTVKESIDSFVQDAEQFDDITMLCLYYDGQNESGDH